MTAHARKKPAAPQRAPASNTDPSQPSAKADIQRQLRAHLAALTGGLAPDDYLKAWWQWYLGVASQPPRQAALAQSAYEKALDSWQFAAQASQGAPLSPERENLGFGDEAWNAWPFNAVARTYSNWASWWYTADFTLFQPHWFKAPPFEDPQDYANRSSITFVKNIHTPVMFVLGESDYRTPQDSGGEQLFRALKLLKRPTAMVVFPRETHELSRSGEPWHRIERLDHIVAWFDKWIMGLQHPEYDVRPE